MAGLTAAVIVAPAALGVGPSASAGELAGRMVFTASEPFYTLTDRNGTFTGQVTWSAPGMPMAWSFSPAPQLHVIATSPMTCTAGHMQLPYSDKHVVPVQYTWHSTVPGHALNTEYLLFGTCRFSVNVRGRPGLATLTIKFSYRMQ